MTPFFSGDSPRKSRDNNLSVKVNEHSNILKSPSQNSLASNEADKMKPVENQNLGEGLGDQANAGADKDVRIKGSLPQASPSLTETGYELMN